MFEIWLTTVLKRLRGAQMTRLKLHLTVRIFEIDDHLRFLTTRPNCIYRSR